MVRFATDAGENSKRAACFANDERVLEKTPKSETLDGFPPVNALQTKRAIGPDRFRITDEIGCQNTGNAAA
jgi:hypothetical protein